MKLLSHFDNRDLTEYEVKVEMNDKRTGFQPKARLCEEFER